jgi:hypothetical protein
MMHYINEPLRPLGWPKRDNASRFNGAWTYCGMLISKELGRYQWGPHEEGLSKPIMVMGDEGSLMEARAAIEAFLGPYGEGCFFGRS